MSHMNGGWYQLRDPGHSSADSATGRPIPSGSNTLGCKMADGGRGHGLRRNSSADALNTLADRPLAAEQAAPDRSMYSQSDARVIQGWKNSRPYASTQQVYPGTMQPKYSMGSPSSKRPGAVGSGREPRNHLERVDTLLGDVVGQQPECPVCYETFCDSESARVPRSLHCGHSFCTGEWSSLLKTEECVILEDTEWNSSTTTHLS